MHTKTIVIKVGSGLVVTDTHMPNRKRISALIRQIRSLQQSGICPLLVISGAVACGKGNFLHISESDEETRQMFAASGQAMLTTVFHAMALRYHVCISQFLLTKDDMNQDQKKHRIRNILKKTIQSGCVPIINENDAISLNSFGGNDHLAQEVAHCIGADAAVMLTNVSGVMDFSSNRVVDTVCPEESVMKYVKQEISNTGVGGMNSKVQAAKTLQCAGIPTVIADGREQNILVRMLVNQESFGTTFLT